MYNSLFQKYFETNLDDVLLHNLIKKEVLGGQKYLILENHIKLRIQISALLNSKTQCK
jgi:hypothetical protein